MVTDSDHMITRRGRDGIYHQERAGLTRSNWVIGSLLVISCVALSVLWFFYFSGFWSISDIQVGQLQMLDRGEVVSSTYEILDQHSAPWNRRNIFLIDTDELISGLRERLFAESVTVEKSYPNVLRLIIKERQRSVVVASGSQLLNVDTDGIVTGEAEGDDADQSRLLLNGVAVADQTHHPVVETDLSEAVTTGYQAADAGEVKRWIESYRAFIGSGMRFRYLHLTSPTSTTVYVVSTGGYRVIMDMLQPLDPQIETFLKFLRTKSKDYPIYEYVDVRIPGKLYVK
jgi:hypothetical protein